MLSRWMLTLSLRLREVVCYSSYWRRALNKGGHSRLHCSTDTTQLGFLFFHPPNQSATMFVVTLSRRQVGRSGRFQRISEKSQVETSMCGSTGTQSTKAPATNRALAGKVDGQVSGLLLCSVMTACTTLDGGRKPSCKWPHPMSDNSTRRDMPTGTFLTSCPRPAWRCVRCWRVGSPDGCPHRPSGPRPGRRR
jgi:hypothetical protein